MTGGGGMTGLLVMAKFYIRFSPWEWNKVDAVNCRKPVRVFGEIGATIQQKP
jgi:hypothetical protein